MIDMQKRENKSMVAIMFYLALIFLPFNEVPYFHALFGELANEAAFYFLLLGLLFFLFKFLMGNKIIITNNLAFYLLITFLVWVIISIGFNMNSITTNFTKGRSGIEKILFQSLVLLFGFLVTLYISYIFSRNGNFLDITRKYVKISFLISAAYSIIELLVMFFPGTFDKVLLFIDQFIRGNDTLYGDRIRSVSGEASWFAMYSSFAFPWVLSYLFTTKRRKLFYYILISFFLLLIFLSKSRVAYVITIVQIFVFLFLIVSTKMEFATRKKLKRIAIFLVTLVLFSVIIFEVNIFGTIKSLFDSEKLSNVSRFGSLITAILIGWEHPFFGIGLGQYGFYMPDYVPQWAIVNSIEIRNWMDHNEGTPWAPVHNLYARIFAETGSFGLVLWLCVWMIIIYQCIKKYRKQSKNDILAVSLITCAVGVFLSGMNLDSFRFFGIWFVFGLAFVFLRRKTCENSYHE